MHTFTKVFLIVVAVFVLLFGGWYAFQSYLFNHPVTEITFFTSGEGDVNVFTVPQYTLEPRSSWGLSEEWDNRYFDVYDIINDMIFIATGHKDDEPYFFDSKVEIIGETTVFTIEGYYTENGERIDVHKEYALDYVVAEKIEEHEFSAHS